LEEEKKNYYGMGGTLKKGVSSLFSSFYGLTSVSNLTPLPPPPLCPTPNPS